MTRRTVTAAEREVRAGARVLRSLLSHDHPVIRRAMTAALDDLTFADLYRFTDKLDASLLEGAPLHAHVHEARD